MDKEALADELRGIAAGYLEGRGLELVELICRYEAGRLVVRLLADWPEGGITLGECAGLNAQLGAILDERGIIEGHYILEVSSPGLDRPLSTRRDFSRCLGKPVKLFLRRPIEEMLEVEGKVIDAQEENILIEAEGRQVSIPLADISKAKQIINEV